MLDVELIVTVSIGISLFPTNGEGSDDIIKNADMAMYYVKGKGGNGYQIYNSSLDTKSYEKLMLENNLRMALKKEEFVLYYQTQSDLRTGDVIGMEALIRWENPELGLISPDKFIPLAEVTGLIVPIGKWVLYTACYQNKLLQERGYRAITVSVNLSIRQFFLDDIVVTVKQVLQDTKLEAKYLKLEITESIAMEEEEIVINKLQQLNKLGVQIYIDDFGKGFSSLNYIKKMPIDGFKIDRSFIKQITLNETDAKIVEHIITLGHSLNLSIVAEGVELSEQVDLLNRIGCDQIQGFYVQKPLPISETIYNLV